MTLNKKLDDVTNRLYEAYTSWKENEKKKDEAKNEFFDLANESFNHTPLGEKLVKAKRVGDESITDMLQRVERFHPGWQIDDHRLTDEEYEVILIEDIKVTAFTHVNVEMEKVFQKTVRKGSPMLDEEYLKAEDPDLHETLVYELPWGEKVVRPISSLDEDLLMKVQKYIYIGPPKVALAAPRDAKPEEL